MFAGHEFHPVITHNAVFIIDNITHLYECRTPEPRIQGKIHKIGKPFLLQQFRGFCVFLAVLTYQTEVLLQRFSFALADTAGQVSVQHGIAVNVIQPATVRVFVVDSHLVSISPVRYILLVRESDCWSSCAVSFKPFLLEAFRARVIISDRVGRSNQSRIFDIKLVIVLF